MNDVVNDSGDDAKVSYQRKCALKTYFFILVGMGVFMDKGATYDDVVYLKYFVNMERIHEYNWKAICLVYLYSKLVEGNK